MSDPKELPIISCTRCVAPGTCCKAFPLSNEFPLGITPDQLREWLKEQGLPFEPLRRYHYGVNSKNPWEENSPLQWKEQWQFSCTKLGTDGRCTIYDERPNLCKVYTAGNDHMCVHMRLPDGNPIIPLLPPPNES